MWKIVMIMLRRGEEKKNKKDKNSESVKIKSPLMSFWNLIT